MLFGAQIKEFPSQKKSTTEKNEEWKKQCVDAAESLIFFQNQGLRDRRLQKKVNYDLYNGVINKADMERICNPFNIQVQDFPAQPKNYPITNPYIQALKGEEIKRRFDWKVIVVNEDAISDKEQQLKTKVIDYLRSVVEKELNGQQVPDEEIEKRIKYLKYDYQDLREISATRLLEFYTKYLDVKTTFSKGWEDFLLVGEEIYAIEEINNNPSLRKCNPLNTYFLTSPNSNYIEDCDIVLEESYIPTGQVIDNYYSYLTPDEIDMLEKRQGPTSNNESGALGYTNKPMTFLDTELNSSGYLDTNNIPFSTIGGAYDSQGNVRVLRAVWKSLRKVGVLEYYDENLGHVSETVSEEYKLSAEEKALGVTLKWIWINEAWEGTKIASSIYVKMEPRKLQFRKSDDLSYCSLGYVGTMCNTNSSKVQSLFDIMKPYQYSYNAYAYRLELAHIKSYGKIGEIDLAEIPDGWTHDMAMYYATVLGFKVKDSFKEAKKGAATGKIVGNMTGHSNVMDMEQRSIVSQTLEMLQYLDQQLAVITGINRQRQGQVSGDDGLGTTQEARAASATITESYFKMHDNTKIRVLRHLLESAKYCVKNGNKKIQNVLDDMTSSIYSIDGEQLNEAEYGILVGDAAMDTNTIQAMQRATEMAIQTGTVNLTQLMDVYSTESLSSIRRKIEEAEAKKLEQQQQQLQQEQQMHQQQLELQKQIHDEELYQRELDRQLQQYKIDSDNQTKIQVAQINVYSRQEDLDQNDNGIPDPMELAKQSLEENRFYSDRLAKAQELRMKEIQHLDKVNLEKEKLKSKENIEKLKIKQTEIQNKSQERISKKQAELKEKEIKAKKEIAKSKPKPKK